MSIKEKCLENLENIPIFYEKLMNDKLNFEKEIKQRKKQLEELGIDLEISNEQLKKISNEQNLFKAKIDSLNSTLLSQNFLKQDLFEKVCKITNENLNLETRLDSKTKVLEQKKEKIEKLKEKFQKHEEKLNRYFSDVLRSDEQMSNIDQVIEILEMKKKTLETDAKNFKFSNHQEVKDLVEEIKEKNSILHCLISDYESEINEKRIKNELMKKKIEEKKVQRHVFASKKNVLKEEINKRNEILNKKKELVHKIKVLEENLKHL
ncbi:hypothetical protein BpHYR1_029214 [Brachionus plicatilis]|uniref:Uncharacterized protein n=1 Tax=Brachionus plicatilis TaxID=10195 RepID=A0A3M7S3Y2_BRAPC|nr:hypothetical protein BpHYR1_029214 [Brachionus plicatilis]